MVNQPITAFLVGANKKLGSTSECLLLSEIYVRGKESSSFVMSREYVEKVFGIKRTSQVNYYKKFEELNLCKVEVVGGKRVIKPNMRAILKFIEEGSAELINDLDSNNIKYEIKKPKKTKPKKAKQSNLLKSTFKSKIDYEYMVDSAIVKEYKNLRAKGTTFKGRDGICYNLSKLDNALNTNDFSKITPTDLTEYFIIIYEQYYKQKYPRNSRDVQNMKKFLNLNLMDISNTIDWFIYFVERYEPLGYSTEDYPRFNTWALTVNWVVMALMENKPKSTKKAKVDGVVRWDNKIDVDSDLYEESDEEF